jgi:lipoprotein-releasing system ATP-binding protein
MDSVLSMQGVTKTFNANGTLDVLKGIDFDLLPNEVVALTGASGTGKTTLLQIMGLIDTPTKGCVSIMGTTFNNESHLGLLRGRKERTESQTRNNFRSKYIGFVYQYHHLLPELTALENVMLPLMIAHQELATKRAWALLEEMKLTERANHLPNQLSGGEQQRVAIARALANSPKIILADEPTGNLDDRTAHRVFDLLLDLANQKRISAVIATHNTELAQKTNRRLDLHLGRLPT